MELNIHRYIYNCMRMALYTFAKMYVCFARPSTCGFYGGDDKHIIGDRYSVTRL